MDHKICVLTGFNVFEDIADEGVWGGRGFGALEDIVDEGVATAAGSTCSNILLLYECRVAAASVHSKISFEISSRWVDNK